MSSSDDLSIKEARHIALSAQNFLPTTKKTKQKDRRHLAAVLGKVGLFQIDSINVLVRSHYLPLFSRLGAYPKRLLEEAAYGRLSDRRLFEYWGHEASLIPVDLQPHFRWRMERARRFKGLWKDIAEYGRNNAAGAETILKEITQRGGLGISDFKEERRRASWWGWKNAKIGLEWLFWTGQVTTAKRRNFERIYDLPERVLPKSVLAAPTPSREEAQRSLLRIAAKACGVATEGDLRDYFRLSHHDAKPRITELVETGELIPVNVEGWTKVAYLHREAATPMRLPGAGATHTAALLSPFDSLIWERSRTQRLFDFHYRMEVYTPAEKRRYGYYVLPFLLGDSLTARVDLKADRSAETLAVRGAFGEPGIEPARIAAALIEELGALAHWLGMLRIRIGERGDLAPYLLRHGKTASKVPVGR